jgi:hypothetical protein
MAGVNPFGAIGGAALPGGGGNYLTYGPGKEPARHLVMIENIRYKAPGFKSEQGTVVEDLQILKTDVENHKVGASYARVYNLKGVLSMGNFKQDLAAFRTAILGREVPPQEITDVIAQVATGLLPLTVASDPELFAASPGGYRGHIVVAVCHHTLTTAKKADFTICSFCTPLPSDLAGLEHLFAPAEA